MKKIVLVLFFLSYELYAIGQSSSSHVVAAAGGQAETSEYEVSWTLGDIAIETLESSSFVLTQGFQQAYFEITSIEKFQEEDLLLKVYPNPAADYIYITLESDKIKSVRIELFDLEGKIVINQQWYCSGGPYKIALNGLNSSFYFLKISTPAGKLLQTFKIIKR